MKVAAVDRIGSWRPPNADARAAVASRMQSIAPGAGESVDAQNLASSRELPPTPVQTVTDVLARPVLQSDAPLTAELAAPSNAQSGPLALAATVDLFQQSGFQDEDGAAVDADAPSSLLAAQLARDNPDQLTNLELSTRAAVQRAVEEARKAEAQPPKEPLSKMLMEQVKSLWQASGMAVEDTLNPPPATVAAAKAAAAAAAAAADTNPTYSIPRTTSR